MEGKPDINSQRRKENERNARLNEETNFDGLV